MKVLEHNIAEIFDLQDPLRDCVLHENKVWSYGAVNNLIKNTALWMSERGVKPGSVVALVFNQDISTFVCMFSVARLGATVLTVPNSMTETPRTKIFSRCKVTHVIRDTDLAFDKNIDDLFLDYKTLLSMASQTTDAAPYCSKPASPWSIIIGSGSTGKSKLMAITHEQQIARTHCALNWLPYTNNDTMYSFVSIKFNATKQRYLEALMRGSSILIATEETTIDFRNTRVNALFGTVFHFEKLLESGINSSNTNPDRPLIIITGGSTVSQKFREKITTSLTPNLYVVYGTNETHTSTVTRLDELLATKNGVGRPILGHQIEIVDAKGEILPLGSTGEVRVKFPGMVTKYMDDAQATEQYFKGGWFYPGDSGSMLPTGEFLHLGRSDDLMHYNGINVYPAEIEAAMLDHPNVVEAYAFPINHPVHQNIPVCVVCVDSQFKGGELELQQYCREQLGPNSAHAVFIIKTTPKTARGKASRKKLKEYVLTRIKGKPGVSTSDEVSPYDPPSKQLKMTFTLPSNSKNSFARLRKWLHTAIEIDAERLKVPKNDSPQNDPKIYLNCLFSFSEILFQQSGIPVFEPPTVVKMMKAVEDEKVYQIVFKFNEAEMIPSNAYTFVFNRAFKLCSWMTENKLSEENRATLYKMVESDITKPLKQRITIGKSTIPILRVAHQKGIPYTHLGIGVFKLGWGSKAKWLDRSITPDDSVIASRLTHSKFTAVSLMKKAGLPVPDHELVESESSALAAAKRIGYPVVAKPNDLDRGEGVTVDIFDDDALLKAFAYARKAGPNKQVLVEKQAQGVCHRLFVSKGRLLYAVKRNPMSIDCDGEHTLAQLIEAEVRRQRLRPTWLRSEIMPLDDLAREAIAAAGYTDNSVPEKGVRVPLRRIESTQWGGVDDEVTHSIHPENLRIAIDAAKMFGLNASGIDIITSDITRPWFETGAIINEVNFSPLLGGGEISRRYISEFLERLVEGDGKIPIEKIESDTPKIDALKRQAQLIAKGLRCYVSSQYETIDYKKRVVQLSVSAQKDRIGAVLARPDADALVVYTSRKGQASSVPNKK